MRIAQPWVVVLASTQGSVTRSHSTTVRALVQPDGKMSRHLPTLSRRVLHRTLTQQRTVTIHELARFDIDDVIDSRCNVAYRRQINQFHHFKIEQSLLERFDISPEENSWVATKAK